MSQNLIDANQPAHAIVETYDNGGAKRNDGTELTPANENPWYVLATIHGEQDAPEIDWDLHARNRRIWNGWMGAQLADSAREELAKQLQIDVAELRPLNKAEQRSVEAAFRDRLPGNKPPDPTRGIDCSRIYFSRPVAFAGPTRRIDCSGIYFSRPVAFSGFVFPGRADFRSATFGDRAIFRFATFGNHADFESATFGDHADFASATFSGWADFQIATFNKEADFGFATFSALAIVESARFDGLADFESAMFSGPAIFAFARFRALADFSDGAFRAATDFTDAIFETHVPKFFQRALHQDTVFTTDDANWPEITAENAADGKRAYTRLRQLMNELHKPDDEHFFFRREMRCNAHLEGWPHRALI